MEAYLDGALQDLEERIRYLKGRVRPKQGRSNDALIKTCREHLDYAASRSRVLREDPKWRQPAAASSRYREFRALVGILDELEYTVVQVLVRWDDADDRANDLVNAIADEIKYPLPSPVAACQSREYYRIYPALGLLLIPPAENASLLHLPDLYHELAHPLLLEDNDPQLEPLRRSFLSCWNQAQTYIHSEIEAESVRRQSPRSFRLYLEGWRQSWRSWLVEFFCDAFAAYVLGPAYVWAHFHLTAKRGVDPYSVPLGAQSTHPADAARFEVLREVLKVTEWSGDAAAIAQRWQSLMNLGGSVPTPEYQRCFPNNLLIDIAAAASAAIAKVGCPAASAANPAKIGGTLTEAWNVFWREPTAYRDWQRQQLIQLGLQPLGADGGSHV